MLVAEPFGSGALEVRTQREHDFPGRLRVEDVGQVLDLQLGVAAEQLVVVDALDAGVAEDERLVSDDLAEQRSERILPLELELGAVVDRHGLRDNLAIGRDDRPPWTVRVPQCGADIAGVVGEVVRVDDLEVRQLPDEHEHEDDDRERDAPNRAVHVVPVMRLRACANGPERCRRTFGATTRGSRSSR